MARRKIIEINLKKCNGCGECIPNCPEGALQIIDEKARLVSDLFCDGLGACLGHCPVGAIRVIEREAEPYNETKVMENIAKQGANTIKAHLEHLKDHGEEGFLSEAIAYLKSQKIPVPLDAKPAARPAPCACPGSRVADLRHESPKESKGPREKGASHLAQWPVQIMLVPAHAPFFKGADLLIAADCVPFAYPDFHEDLLKGKVLLVGCPKLDDVAEYAEKFKSILKENDIKSVTYAHMEVPCCFGLISPIEDAIAASGKKIPFEEVTISIRGERS